MNLKGKGQHYCDHTEYNCTDRFSLSPILVLGAVGSGLISGTDWKIDLLYMFFMVREIGPPGGNSCSHEEKMLNANRKAVSEPGVKPTTFLR